MNAEMARVGEVGPEQAWTALTTPDCRALLIDVRTRAEWSFVGVPDLSSIGQQTAFVEWQGFPTMQLNPDFVTEVIGTVEELNAQELYFLCRSGARSLSAAVAISQALQHTGCAAACVNVAEGFEGDLNAEGRRGEVNGWKARGLPWRQS
ncbi:MAG: rhodanese-like domain-containing protein [Pikeienuella sp.]